ncbi:hypothetical protein AB3X34_24865, partial [Raoultella terrigena]|uniref:hypothetical protein n=1 Tax=Raoultella terrigena TaxID=577 RepID=UPI00349F720A
SSLIAHRSSLIAHRSSLIAHRSSLIAHRLWQKLAGAQHAIIRIGGNTDYFAAGHGAAERDDLTLAIIAAGAGAHRFNLVF